MCELPGELLGPLDHATSRIWVYWTSARLASPESVLVVESTDHVARRAPVRLHAIRPSAPEETLMRSPMPAHTWGRRACVKEVGMMCASSAGRTIMDATFDAWQKAFRDICDLGCLWDYPVDVSKALEVADRWGLRAGSPDIL